MAQAMSPGERYLRREMKPVVRALEEQGWTIRGTSKGHVMCMSPTGAVVVNSGTTSDWRSSRNFLSQLKRAGLVLERT